MLRIKSDSFFLVNTSLVSEFLLGTVQSLSSPSQPSRWSITCLLSCHCWNCRPWTTEVFSWSVQREGRHSSVFALLILWGYLTVTIPPSWDSLFSWCFLLVFLPPFFYFFPVFFRELCFSLLSFKIQYLAVLFDYSVLLGNFIPFLRLFPQASTRNTRTSKSWKPNWDNLLEAPHLNSNCPFYMHLKRHLYRSGWRFHLSWEINRVFRTWMCWGPWVLVLDMSLMSYVTSDKSCSPQGPPYSIAIGQRFVCRPRTLWVCAEFYRCVCTSLLPFGLSSQRRASDRLWTLSPSALGATKAPHPFTWGAEQILSFSKWAYHEGSWEALLWRALWSNKF